MNETGDTAPARRASKSAAAFRTIGEVAAELDLPTHVLRFWESKFPQLQPLKRGGGRRYYRPEDLVLLRRIRQCLYQEGYTIRGVQKLLNGSGETGGAAAAEDASEAPTLFPLQPASDAAAPTKAEPSAKPMRPANRRLSAPARAALADIRRELIEAQALLQELPPPCVGS